MGLSRGQMARLIRLVDEGLSIDEDGRRCWLANLPPEYADLMEVLRESLLREDSSPVSGLETLPKFATVDERLPTARYSLRAGAHLGPYELIRPLGAGGMAEVWLARRADGAFTREVALKLPLRIHWRLDLETRFAREREILARLTHPNIARLYDAGITPDGQRYLALEYVVGRPLTAYCDEKCLSIEARLELFRQVLSAVQYAHAHLVIHRDLKPSNILVTEDARVQLLDFGIAKLLTEGEAKETMLTQVSGRALTPDYAAPEQIAGETITTAADVYALGVILYELLTAERPYRLKRDTRGALEEAILQAEPAAPSRIALSHEAAENRGTTIRNLTRALRGDLDAIAIKALKKSPSERYTTASEFGEDIARFLRGEVVLAQRDSVAYRAFKFARRHRVGFAVAGAVMLMVIAALAVTSYEATVAAAQREIARHEAATSDQVTNYLVSLFDLASPDRSGGKPIDARTLVDLGQRQIADGLGASPLLRKRLLTAVGALDCKIGKSDQCRRDLEQALEIERSSPSGDPIVLATIEYQLASAYNLLGRTNKAIDLLRQAQPVFERQEPRNNRRLADLWYQRGVAERQNAELTKSTVAFEKARALLRDPKGADTLDSADTLGQLAIVYAYASRSNDALALAAERLDLVRTDVGANDLRYLDALNDYAEVANAAGHTVDAEEAWKRVIDGYQTFFGRGNDKVIGAELSLADAFFQHNELRTSIEWFRTAVADYRLQGHPERTIYTGALGGLSQALLLYGDYRAAEVVAREAYQISQRMHGPTPWDAAAVGTRWAHTLALTGQTAQAMELLKTEIPGDPQDRTVRSFMRVRLLSIGDCYREMHELARAEATYDDAINSSGTLKEPQRHGNALNMAYEAKAVLLASERRFTEAVPLYRVALQGYLSGTYASDGPSIAAVRIELAESLFALRQYPEARALMASSAPIVERELAATHPARQLLTRLRTVQAASR